MLLLGLELWGLESWIKTKMLTVCYCKSQVQDLVFCLYLLYIVNIVLKQSCSIFSLLKFQGFENHVKTEHYQWAYLFFFIHLTETRPNDFSALELYVYNLLDRNIYDFFPLNRALSLQNEEDSNERKVEILRVQVDYMVNKMREEVIDNFIL